MVRPQLFYLGAFLFLLLQFSTPPSVVAASKSALDPGYVPALATADHFLQAWQSGDVESGTALLSSHVREAVTSEGVEAFFSQPVPGAYEIERGKLLRRGRYEFPVVLVTETAKGSRARRRFSSIIVVNTGNNDWAVDKLP
ncbi:MAG: hypothetical protein WBQ85_05335 [Candidatus Sulfotelmatobacter sp.]